jgi:hypothetical protein
MRRKFYVNVNISGICHNHNPDAAEGGGAPTPAPVVEPPAPPVEPPVVEPPAVPDGYVPATEVETERTARTAAETRAAEQEARATAAEARARTAEIRAAAQQLGFNDPADAEMFVGADVTDVGAHLAEVVKTKSYLVRAAEAPVTPPVTPTSPTNPARTDAVLPTFTRAQLGDRAFWNANKEAIMQAMKDGRVAT